MASTPGGEAHVLLDQPGGAVRVLGGMPAEDLARHEAGRSRAGATRATPGR